jgi:hypothetical protein
VRRWAIAVVLLSACGPKEKASLIAAESWTEMSAAEDPYAAYRPGPDACPPTSFGVEDLGGENSLFVDAEKCAYLTVSQPASVEIDEDDRLHLRIWHYQLVALKASTATIALTIGGNVVLEEYVPIPSESGLIRPMTVAGFESEPGAPIIFHIRNHGSNSYNLIELSRGGE